MTFKKITSQLCAVLPYYLLKFSVGSTDGFHTILIAELYKENAEIKMTFDQLSWFASLTIINVISCIIYGFSVQRLGCRLLGCATASLLCISWLLYFYSTSVTLIFISGFLIALPSTSTLSKPYISEISEPSVRGSLLTIVNLSSVIGTFFSMLLGSFMYWRTIALVNIIFPLLAAVLILFVTPNSPTWLINKGRLDEAEKALCWLRGWVKPSDVQIEFHALVESLQSESTEDECKLNLETTAQQPQQKPQRIQRFLSNFCQRSFYLPLATLCIIYILQSLSGADLISTYTGVIYPELHSPIDVSLATAITGGASVTGALTALLLTKTFGKRKIAFFSLSIAILCYLSVAIIGFMQLGDSYLWISLIATIVTIFTNSLGVGTSLQVIVSEIFPSSLRYIGTSIGGSIEVITKSIFRKLFLYIFAAITMPGVFLMFVCVNVIAFITYYFLFPETEGRSLKDIEDHYKGIKHLNERQK